MVVLETLEAGIPSIVSDVESLPECVLDSDFVFTDGDVAALSDLLTRKLNSGVSIPPDVNGRLPDQFSWHRYKEQLLEIYHNA